MGALKMADENPMYKGIYPGDLNQHSKNNAGIIDHDSENELTRLRRVVNEFYKNAYTKEHRGTWAAICLHAVVEYYPAGDVPGFSLSNDLGRPVGLIAVVARIPELDFWKPFPKTLGDPTSMDEESLDAFSLHTTFYGPLTGRYGVSEIPAPGDIIEVDFEDRVGRTGTPIYITVLEKGIGTAPDLESDGTESGEAQNAFNSGTDNTSGTVSEYSSKQTSEEEYSQQTQSEVDDLLDDIASDMSANTGISKEAARGILEAELKEQ
jgi:hypothetical protein